MVEVWVAEEPTTEQQQTGLVDLRAEERLVEDAVWLHFAADPQPKPLPRLLDQILSVVLVSEQTG